MMTSITAGGATLIGGIPEMSTSDPFNQQLDCFDGLGSGTSNDESRVKAVSVFPHCYSSEPVEVKSCQGSFGLICEPASKLKTVSNDSGTSSFDDDCEPKLVELETFSSCEQRRHQSSRQPQPLSDSRDMTVAKIDTFQSYQANRTCGSQDFGFYQNSGVIALDVTGNNTTACDSTDNMFDDAFSLDEFMFSQQDGSIAKGVPRTQSHHAAYQDMSANQTVTNITTCDSLDAPQNGHVLQGFMNAGEDPHATNFQTVTAPQGEESVLPPFHEIRNRTFSDLLRSETALDDGQSHSFHGCVDRNRPRDYSLSSDSGVGSSILMDTASSPTTGKRSCEQALYGRVADGGAGDDMVRLASAKNEMTDITRYPSHTSDASRKRSVDDFQATDFLAGEMSPPTDDSLSQPPGEKVSSKKTAYNEKWGVKVLKAWCVEMSVPEDFEQLTPEELNNLLCRFWSEVRKSNGDYYGRNSLFNLRAMINKHLKGKPHCAMFDIVTDERFRTSNDRLEKQLKILKGIGKTITHKQPISIADLRKMYDSNVLGTANPLALLRKVWFEITLHFCHKGSEPQEKLSRTSFHIYQDHNYRAYISRAPNGQSTNDADEIRMYETGGELCPVRSYQMYLQKLHPLQGRLFQQPRRKSTPASPMWYGKAPIGEKALQQMMANISVAAKLSKRYTNHCVRTTALEQFSNSRRKSGGKGTNDKTSSKTARPGVSIVKDVNQSSCFPSHVSQSSYSAPQQMYEAATVGQQDFSQRMHMPQGPSHYQYNASNGVPYQSTHVPNEDQGLGHSSSMLNARQMRQCYKRPVSMAYEHTQSNGQNNGHNLPPPPPYPGQPAPKRARLDHCQVFLSGGAQSGPPNTHVQSMNDGTQSSRYYYDYPAEAHDAGLAIHENPMCDPNGSMPGIMSPRKGLSETIIAGAHVTDHMQNQNFTMLSNFV